MKIERTRNATRNIVYGMLLKIYQILLPFIIRTVMIYFMGVQYLGLDSLFLSILQVLNLAELGVGSAMVYSMYKPIAEDDSVRICALLKLYRTYYRLIGLVVAVMGVMLLPFVPRLIKSDLPNELNVYALYLLNLSVTVLSYWLFAYKNALFQAHQRVDITSKVMILTKTFQYVAQIIVIIFIKDYYIYVMVALATQIMTNIVTACAATKMYPEYIPVGKLEKETITEINHRIRDLFTSKLGAVVVNSVDTVVISAFLGLKILAVYQNYYFILTAVIGVIAIIFNSCTAGIGNSLIIETKEKNYNDLKKFTFLIAWLAGVCSCCFLTLYQPFMKLWVGEDLQLKYSAVICFCIYFFVYEINQLLNLYKDAGGIWHKDRFRPLVTALVNLILNLVMVHSLGIYGIILSTVISMVFVGMPWLIRNLFSTIFSMEYLERYLKRLLGYVMVSLLACVISVVICSLIHSSLILTILLRAVISFLVPNIIFVIVYYRLPEFKDSILLVNKMTKGKLHLDKLI